MKLILPLICIALISISVTAQRVDDPDNDGIDNNTGCAYRDSGHIDDAFNGRVTRIIDGDSVVVATTRGIRMRVNLIAVNASSRPKEAKAYLKDNLLNRDVDLVVSSSQFGKTRVNGTIYVGDKDINATLLERGLGVYRSVKSYQISRFRGCLARKSEERAKSLKMGIWAEGN